MTAQEFKARVKMFRDRTAIVALILFSSGISWFILFIWLGSIYHPERTESAFVVSAVLGPFVFMLIALRYSSWLARRMGLTCPHCRTPVSSSMRSASLAEGRCRKCAESIFDSVS